MHISLIVNGASGKIKELAQVAPVVRYPPANAGDVKRPGFDPWVQKDPLEEGMATFSSALAWRIPWTEEPGRLHGVAKCRK